MKGTAVKVGVHAPVEHSHINGVPGIIPNLNARFRQQIHQHQPQNLTSSARCAELFLFDSHFLIYSRILDFPNIHLALSALLRLPLHQNTDNGMLS
jgi:hypothetical protein